MTDSSKFLVVAEELLTALHVYGREALPEEACGILIGKRMNNILLCTHTRTVRNLHPHSDHLFMMDPLEYAKAERYCKEHQNQKLSILGFWHSHPKGPAKPSKIDREQARGLYQSFPIRYAYLILGFEDLQEIECRAWQLREDGQAFEELKLGKQLPNA